MIVSALVTGVRKDRIRVNVMGAETTIHSEELSHTTLESLDREFEVGDAFEVKVSDIQEYEHVAFGNTFHLVTLKASKKATTIHPNKNISTSSRLEIFPGVLSRQSMRAFTFF